MPSKTKKNISVILFDLKMNKEKSLCILDEIIWHKNIVDPNDTTRLVLINSSKTQNKRNEPNIYEVKIDIPPKNIASKKPGETLDIPYTYHMKTGIDNAETANSNWLTGLEICADILSEQRSNVFSLQIIFITDLGSPLPEAQKFQAEVVGIINKLRELKIDLFIVGPRVDYGMTMKSEDDVKTAMQMCKFVESTPESIQNEKIVLELASQTSCVVCSGADCVDFLSFVTKAIPKQPWNVPLTLEGFKFPTLTTKITDPISLPRPKPQKNIRRNKPAVQWGEIRQKWPIDEYKVIKGLEDIKKQKIVGDRKFKIIGFVDAAKIPEFFIGGRAFHVSADPLSSKAEAFYHLVRATSSANKYGLVVRVRCKNEDPELFVLIPLTATCRFLMVPHPGPVDGSSTLSDPINASPGKANDFKLYLEKFPKPKMRLAPWCSTSVCYKVYMRKLLEIINNGHRLEEATTLEADDGEFTAALAKIQERLKMRSSAIVECMEPQIVNSDSDGED